MLTETFIASTLATAKNPSSSSLPKDASIFLHDFQPTKTLRGHFNQSITEKNCLAITQTHVFAAQKDRAVVKVFSRQKGTLETFVAFHEHVSSLACIGPDDGASILVLGTDQGKSGKGSQGGGRLMLWEVCTGRIIQTETSHIQPVTSLVVDITNNYILSGSADSQIHVWNVPALLSFSELDEPDQHSHSSPLRTLTGHDAGITSIVTGHSHMPLDIAVSASLDKRCNIWEYRTGQLLHTFLMGGDPLCLAMDPIDRAFYAGMSDGAIQMINFHKSYNGRHPLYDENLNATPTEAPESDRWTTVGSDTGAVLSIDVSYDGYTVLAGHESGAVSAWNVAVPQNPTSLANLAQPVTNLRILPPTGFPAERETQSRLNGSSTKPSAIVKPRPDTAVAKPGSSGLYVPERYIFSTCFVDSLIPGYFKDENGSHDLLADFERETEPDNPDLPSELWSSALRDIATNPVMGNQADNSLDNNNRLWYEKYVQTQVKLKIAILQQSAMMEKMIASQRQVKRTEQLSSTRNGTGAGQTLGSENSSKTEGKNLIGGLAINSDDDMEDEEDEEEDEELEEDTEQD